MNDLNEKNLDNVNGGFDFRHGKVCGKIKVYYTEEGSTETKVHEHDVGTDYYPELENVAKQFCKFNGFTYISFEYIPNEQ